LGINKESFLHDFLNTNKPKPSLEGLFTFSVRLPSDLNGPHTFGPDVKIYAPTDPDIEN